MESPIQTDFIRWIVFLPLIGAIVNGLLGAKIQKTMGKGAIGVIACAPVIIAFGLSVNALLTLKNLAPEKRETAQTPWSSWRRRQTRGAS